MADELQRIASEALLNAFRHAKATEVRLRACFTPGALKLEVDDHGVGMDRAMIDNGVPAGHWGLRGMKARAERTGGLLNIDRSPNGGTTVTRVLSNDYFQGRA